MQTDAALSQLLWNPNSPIQLRAFALNLVLAAAFGLVLGRAYVRCGRSLSNRRQFAGNFLLLTVTTTLVISIVKSSLALSLGLVGALSIVRFRAAIKEPEELIYLFLAISLGLGLGAGQPLITAVALGVILVIIFAQHRLRRRPSLPNLHVSINAPLTATLSPTRIEAVFRDCGLPAELRRYDTRPDGIQASFRIGAADSSRLEKALQQLNGLGENVSLSCVAENDLTA